MCPQAVSRFFFAAAAPAAPVFLPRAEVLPAPIPAPWPVAAPAPVLSPWARSDNEHVISD